MTENLKNLRAWKKLRLLHFLKSSRCLVNVLMIKTKKKTKNPKKRKYFWLRKKAKDWRKIKSKRRSWVLRIKWKRYVISTISSLLLPSRVFQLLTKLLVGNTLSFSNVQLMKTIELVEHSWPTMSTPRRTRWTIRCIRKSDNFLSTTLRASTTIKMSCWIPCTRFSSWMKTLSKWWWNVRKSSPLQKIISSTGSPNSKRKKKTVTATCQHRDSCKKLKTSGSAVSNRQS